MPDEQLSNKIIVEKFNNLVSKSNIVLINDCNLDFLGTLSFSLEKQVMDVEEYKAQGIPVASLGFTDGKRLVYLATEETLDIFEIIFTTLHEVIHIISDHIGRGKDKDSNIWLVAIDHVTNRTMKKLTKVSQYVKWFDHDIYYEDIDQQYPEATAEYVYELLSKNKSKYGLDKIEESQVGGKKIIVFTDKQTGQQKIAVDDISYSNMSQKDIEQIKENIQEIKDTAQALWSSNCIEKGNLDAGLIRALNKIFEVKVPWEDIVENSLLYLTQNRQESSWSYPNELIKCIRLPGESHSSAPQTAIFGIDVSGSISENDIEKFSGVVCNSCDYYERLILLIHDVYVQEQLEIDDIKALGKYALFDRIKGKIKGGGGTSHKYVFDVIEELKEECDLSTILFQTDYYSDVQSIYKKYSFLKEFETIWLIPEWVNNYRYGSINKTKSNFVNLPGCETKTVFI